MTQDRDRYRNKVHFFMPDGALLDRSEVKAILAWLESAPPTVKLEPLSYGHDCNTLEASLVEATLHQQRGE
jgi:hypothetical protein